ncbi:MAG: type II secretion system protein N, partial [Nitrospirota bacterium]|nr:type II secretion system protein N [Nitrospirota bacterium]
SPEKKAVINDIKSESLSNNNLQIYASILEKNPFGFPGGKLRSLSNQPPALSGTDIVLIGTVAGRESDSYAIFMAKVGKQEIFRVGDSVFNLGILRKVEKDRVVIGKGEKITEIPLREIVSARETRRNKSRSSGYSGFTRKINATTYSIDQRRIQQAIENPRDLMTDARLLPNIVDGRQQGYTMREVKKGGIYDSLGLRNGDVLLKINEFDISNPEYALQAFTALRGMERVRMNIIRNGAKMTMTYQIK